MTAIMDCKRRQILPPSPSLALPSYKYLPTVRYFFTDIKRACAVPYMTDSSSWVWHCHGRRSRGAQGDMSPHIFWKKKFCTSLQPILEVFVTTARIPRTGILFIFCPRSLTIRYDTIGEFNVDSKAEYSALSSTRSQKKKLKQTTPVPL